MNCIIRFFKVLFVIVLLSSSLSSSGQSNNCRAFYLPNINVWLGNTAEENTRLNYAASNGFNYIIFYDLHLIDFNNSIQTNKLADFLSRARNNYGITQAGACAESYSFFQSKIIPYNNSRNSASEKFNVLNFEFEFWVQSTITQYYCNSYLQPGGYNCDTAGAWAYSFKQFKKIDSLCAANGLISEVYIGWPNKGQMQNLATFADRILLHAYQTSDAGLYSYTRNRLIDAASINQSVIIIPIFSSESSFLGPWLQTHPIYQPYQTYTNNFTSETGTWKQNINLQGYTWFYYPTMPQTTSGTASITAGGSTTLCLGDSVVLTSSPGAQYFWSPGGETTQSVVVKQTGNYFVNVISANGASVTSAPVAVSVGVNQVPIAVTASGPVSFCTGESVTLTCSSPGPYAWNNGATSSSITVNNTSDYYVSVQTGNCTASSTPVHVDVSDLPPVPVISGGNIAVCPGAELTLHTSATGNILWSTGDMADSTVIDTAGEFWVRVYNNPGCFSQSQTTTVSYLPSPPDPVVSPGGTTTICDGDVITLTSTPANEYLWSNGETTQSITVSQAGDYFVTVTDGDCNTVLSSQVTTVNVLAASPQIMFEGSNTFCTGDSVKLFCNMPASSYLWSNGSTSSFVYISDPATLQLTIQTGNCSFTSPSVNVFETNSIPAPVITLSGPATLCPGQSITLTSDAADSYLWSDGSTTRSITVSQPGTYSVTIQTGSCTANSDPVIIDVNNSPLATAISASGPLTFCEGGSVTLTAAQADSYLWSNGATTSSVVITQTGNYSVTTQNGGCNYTSAVTGVTVETPLPAPVITADGPLTFCSGGSVTLTSGSAPNYLWSTGATTSSITVTQSGNYTVTVSRGTCSITSSPKVVTVNPPPAKPVITASGSTSLCSGQNVTLFSNSPNSNVWSTGATTVSITVTQAGNYTVSIGTGSCKVTSDPKSVTVSSVPAKPAISANSSLNICPGSAVTLTSSALTQNIWSTGATTRSIVVSAAGSYWVKVTQNGCTSSQSNTSSVTLKSAPSRPTITVTSGSTYLQSSSSSVTLRSSTASSYLWSNNSSSRSVVIRAAGVYRVTVTNSVGCTATSNDLKVTSKTCTPPAAPMITLSGSNVLQPGTSVVLTSSTASGYLWSNGATTRSITVSTAGTYTVRAYSSGSCYSTSLAVKIYIITARLAATDEEVMAEEWKAYPNPAHEMITFSFYSAEERDCMIRITDLNGREVDMHTIRTINGRNTFELNLSDFKKGFYVASLLMEDKSKYLKIIVE